MSAIISAKRRPNQYSLDLGFDHLDLVHQKQVGTVLIWEQQKTSKAWTKIEPDQARDEVRDFLRGLSGGPDTYFSVNEFQGWRLTRLLKSLRACYVDLDLDRECGREDVNLALEILRDAMLPAPNIVVFSGRGLHLYWVFKHTPSQALPVWQAMEKVLIDALKPMQADPLARDCTRVLRLPGTTNSRNEAEVRGLVLDGRPWGFHQLTDEVLGHRKPSKIKSLDAERARRGDHPRSTPWRRWNLVLADLHAIGRHHGHIPIGYRNEFLYLSSVALSWFAAPETIDDEVKDMANLYAPSLSVQEASRAAMQSIIRATEAAGGMTRMWGGVPVDPRYRFKRHTLWDRMAYLAEPIKHRLRAIIPDELADEREAKRQKARDRVLEGRYCDKNTGEGYRMGNAEKVDRARVMRDEGRSQREIADEIGVGVSTVNRWLSSVPKSPL